MHSRASGGGLWKGGISALYAIEAQSLSRGELSYDLNVYRTKAAREVIEEAERLELSERDSLRVLELLENPPKPNAKLLRAAKLLRKRK